MTEMQEHLSVVKFGIEVEMFLQTPIGKYLVGRAHEELDAARDALELVNAVDIQEVRQLQVKAYMARSFDKWLAEAVQEGWNAEAHLKALEEQSSAY